MNIAKRKQQRQKHDDNWQHCPTCEKVTEHSVYREGRQIVMICTKCGNEQRYEL